MARLNAERHGRVMTVRIDNPPRNFMDDEMVDELDALTSRLLPDKTIGAVVLVGSRPGLFVTHYDVGQLVSGSDATPVMTPHRAFRVIRLLELALRMPGARAVLSHTPARELMKLKQLTDTLVRMSRMNKAFVAAVSGTATGAGCELALASDIRIMAEGDFVFGLPELTLGLIPGAGGSQRLVRAVGPSRAIELLLDARPLSPYEALELGLVHRVVPADRLLEAAQETAERLARRSSVSLESTKRLVYYGGSDSLSAGLRLEQAGFMAAVSSPQAGLAMRTFLDQMQQLASNVPTPWADRDAMPSWQEGTAVDLTSDARRARYARKSTSRADPT